MKSLFPSGQVLTQSPTKLVYEISGVFDPEGVYYGRDHLLQQSSDSNYEEEIYRALLNRFGADHKWKKFSFFSEDQVIEFQIRNVVINLNFSSEGLSVTGTAVISVAGEAPGVHSFRNYLGKILKFVIDRVARERFTGVSSTFKIAFNRAGVANYAG